jgi:hypothetical protein
VKGDIGRTDKARNHVQVVLRQIEAVSLREHVPFSRRVVPTGRGLATSSIKRVESTLDFERELILFFAMVYQGYVG